MMKSQKWLDSPRLPLHLMAVTLFFSVVVLLPGLGTLGFWDPWEMNSAHLARSASGPPIVLVAADRDETGFGNLSTLAHQQGSLDASIEWFHRPSKSKARARSLSSKLSQIRAAIAKTDFHVVVVPITSSDAEGSKNIEQLRAFEEHLVSHLPGTRLVYLGASAPQVLDRITETGAPVQTATDTNTLIHSLQKMSDLPRSLLRVRSKTKVQGVPPLKYWLMGASFDLFGQNEFAARLPGALLGILVVLLVFYFGWTLGGPWAGLLSAFVLLGTPYLPVQARNLGGEIGFVAYLGLGVFAIERAVRRYWVAAVGLFVLAFLLLLLDKGLFGPLMLTVLVGSFAITEGRKERGVVLLALGSLIALTLISAWALTTESWSFLSHFRFMHQSFEGGPGTPDRSFDFFMLQTGFSFLPWIALVPFALSWLARQWWDDEETRPLFGLMVLWAAIPFVVVSATLLRFGHAVYPGGPALAVAVGLFGCAMLHKQGPWPIRALFVLLTLFLLVKELKLSGHPLVGIVTWDPTFMFEFKTLHPGIVYPSEVQTPDLLRKFVYLFLLFSVYGVMHAGTLIERVLEWSRGAWRYFGVLHFLVVLWFLQLTGVLWVAADGAVQFMSLPRATLIPLLQYISSAFIEIQAPTRIILLTFIVGYALLAAAKQWGISSAGPGTHKKQNPFIEIPCKVLGFHPRQVSGSQGSGAKRQPLFIYISVGFLTGLASLCVALANSPGAALSAFSTPLVLVLVLAAVVVLVAHWTRPSWLGEESVEILASLCACAVAAWGISALYVVGTKPEFAIFAVLPAYLGFRPLWGFALRNKVCGRLVFFLALVLFFAPVFGAWLSIMPAASSKGYPVVKAILGVKVLGSLFLLQTFAVVGWWFLGWYRGYAQITRLFGDRTHLYMVGGGLVGAAAMFLLGAVAGEGSRFVLFGLGVLFVVHTAIHITSALITNHVSQIPKMISRVQLGLERPRVFLPILAVLGMLVSGMVVHEYMPNLTQHVSQKNILERYLDLENRTELGPNLFRHGQFSGAGTKRNFYVQSVPNIRDSKAALSLLKGESDLAVPLSASPFLQLPDSVVFQAFDSKNDRNSDGSRDWNSDAGVASLIEGKRLIDTTKRWKENQWEGFLLFDSREQRQTQRVIESNDETSLTFRGPAMREKVGVPKRFYRIDHKDAQNHLATAMDKQRAYLMVPKSDFSSLNHKYRKSNGGRSIAVLDDRSSQVVLTASELYEGEENLNWMARAIVSDRDLKEMEGFTPGSINFDNKIYFVGQKVHNQKIRRGGTVKMTLYFKLKAGLARSWKVFVHVERHGGNRIGADHWVLNQSDDQKTCVGCFKTNQWMVGDIIADTFEIDVPSMHPSGRYSVYFGLYDPNANQRLQVINSKPPIKLHKHRAGPVGSFVVY